MTLPSPIDFRQINDPKTNHEEWHEAIHTGMNEQVVLIGGVHTFASRPDADAVAAGTMIFNTDDGLPNWSDGTIWVNADGEESAVGS